MGAGRVTEHLFLGQGSRGSWRLPFSSAYLSLAPTFLWPRHLAPYPASLRSSSQIRSF
jgi:hypothetical protein